MTARLDLSRLVFASHNAGKVDEVRQILAPYGTQVVSAADLGLAEPAETETTFLGNARIKARAACLASGAPALSDDSGLCVEGLDGAPGVYTADWAETPNGRDFGLAMRKVHEALLSKGVPQPWRARFHCTMVLAHPDGAETSFTGDVHGTLVWPIRGATGHGYDPMFVPDGETRTFAEMGEEEKNRLSHRSIALAAFVKACFT